MSRSKATPAPKKKESEPGSLVRINPNDKVILQEIADIEGESMPKILHKAIELYRRERLLKQVNEAYKSLRNNKGAWEVEESEREVWVGASNDGGFENR